MIHRSEDQETHAGRLAFAAREGDRSAFDELIALFQQRISGLTMMMLRNPHWAEEVTQDTFIRAYTNLDLYDERRPFYPWLATIAVRLAQNRQKRQSIVLQREESLEESKNEPAEKTAPIDALLEKETARRLWDAVSALPMGERAAVFLFYRQDMKVDQIARVLGVTGGTIKTLLFRARKKLRSNAAVHAMGQARRKEEKP